MSFQSSKFKFSNYRQVNVVLKRTDQMDVSKANGSDYDQYLLLFLRERRII